jgi:hypothetical protein
VFSASYAIGLTAPDVGNDGLLKYGAGIASFLQRPWSLSGAAATGFATGQMTQRPPVAAPPQPKVYKDEASPALPGAPPGGFGPGPVGPGCSPASLASAPRADRAIVPLAGVQLTLALVLVWQRARERARGGRRGGS